MTERDETLAEWLEAYGDLINRTCCLILGDRALAEDAAQETFIRAWKKGRLIHETERAWLTRVAVNLWADICQGENSPISL